MDYKLVLVKNEERNQTATKVQSILTDFGCNIKVRLGLHDYSTDACSPSGLILLEVSGDDREIDDFTNELNSIENVSAKKIVF